MKESLLGRLDVLQTRLAELSVQFVAIDDPRSETVEYELNNVLRAIDYLETEIRIEQLREESHKRIRAVPYYEDTFTRNIERDLTNIRSVCKNCGAVVIASVRQGLAEVEAIHRSACKRQSSGITLGNLRKAS